MIENFLAGLATAVSVKTLFFMLVGVVWGIIGGAIPGISSSIAMALLLPLTYGMSPTLALPMLASVYVGAEYGGSIPSILINTPGTSANAATCLDGYQMHKRGEGGKALFTSLISGTIGGAISVIILIACAIPLAAFGLKFGPSQYALLGIMGLSVVGSVSGGSPLKGLISAAFGLLLATVGLDPVTATPRFTMGSLRLVDGFDLIVIIVGFFAISEVFSQIFHGDLGVIIKDKVKISFPSKDEFKQFTPIAIISGLLGTFVGALPGAGATVASWMAYTQTKNLCKDNESFGKGDIRGVAAPESANNSCPAGALIPLLALGIPGSGSTAVLLAAFSLQGIAPGPLLFTNRPEIPYTIMASMVVAQIIMLIVGLFLIKPAVKITSISPAYMATAILLFSFIGAFSVTNDVFSIVFALIFGVIGFLMKEWGYSPPAAVLGFVLGALIEKNVRRSLVVSRGEIDIFFKGGINLVLIAIIIFSLFGPLLMKYLRDRKTA